MGPSSPPQKKEAQPPYFQPMSVAVKWSPISATAEHLFTYCAMTSELQSSTFITGYAIHCLSQARINWWRDYGVRLWAVPVCMRV